MPEEEFHSAPTQPLTLGSQEVSNVAREPFAEAWGRVRKCTTLKETQKVVDEYNADRSISERPTSTEDLSVVVFFGDEKYNLGIDINTSALYLKK